ncbi:MAG: efflux RND transporter periplasmic adaptor subunit, partial [Zoogloea sp.]|nr:efflux RND transporter periplasmic adaptor subunit [Zoogloea sp.]
MTDKRHSAIGIHGQQPAGKGHAVQRLRLLKRSSKVTLAVFALLGLGAALVAGQRLLAGRALAAAARDQAVRYVNLVSPMNSATDNVLHLPGTLQGFVEAPLYARTSGYLAAWYKDIGAPVRQGDLIARIDTPEVAQQLLEAKAAYGQAVANLKLAKSSLARWEELRKTDAVSQQEADERRNAYAVAVAAEASNAATVRQLQEQLGYNRITAPFAGVVTKRNIDVGNLVDAGSGTKILFVVTKSDPLRVYIQVPQSYAPQIRIGDKADITLQELPGRVFSGSIVRTAQAIDTVSRTLQVEVDLPNPNGELLPGSYSQVAIK